jgi:hypothetical protein
MKRILDGTIYDTETSVAIARKEYGADDHNMQASESTLYQTQGGALFRYDQESWVARHRGVWDERKKHNFVPMSWDEAYEWLMTGDVEILTDVFPELSEADANVGSSMTTMYLRVSHALKNAIEETAKQDNKSASEWIVQSLERLVKKPRAGND